MSEIFKQTVSTYSTRDNDASLLVTTYFSDNTTTEEIVLHTTVNAQNKIKHFEFFDLSYGFTIYLNWYITVTSSELENYTEGQILNWRYEFNVSEPVEFVKSNPQPQIQYKYLFSDGEHYYTYNEEFILLEEVEKLTSETFIEYGVNDLSNDILEAETFRVLRWSEEQSNKFRAELIAIPNPQLLETNEIILTDATIRGIDSVELGFQGNPLFNVKVDNGPWIYYSNDSWINSSNNSGMTYSVLENISSEEWNNLLSDHNFMKVRVILNSVTDTFTSIKFNFINND